MLDVFRYISKPDIFFMRLQVETGITLIERKSVIIFDEIQLYLKARQAIKHLVKDGRYGYVETGSLISTKKNVKDILISSEEHKIPVYPMDYEEFLWAIGENPDIINMAYLSKLALGNSANRTAMMNFRIYMAVGGMPQAVEMYINTHDFNAVDRIKRDIINLYRDDLKKIDPSGRISSMYKSIPSQLALKKKRFIISAATDKRKTKKDEERLYDLIDSKLVILCYRITQPSASLSLTQDLDSYKLYLSDVGLFTILLFDNKQGTESDIYRKLLSDKLDTDLGYLYENAVAQMITASNRELYYHTWNKENSTHYYEVDFLLSSKNKVIPIEVKSSITKSHNSIDQFVIKYSQIVGERYIVSKKDISSIQSLKFIPFYMFPFF